MKVKATVRLSLINNCLISTEKWFWRITSLALAGIVAFSFASNLRYPWQPKLFQNSDFEMGNLTNWEDDGYAFRNQPTYGDNPYYRNRGIVNHQGNYWIGTFENRKTAAGPRAETQGDSPVGTLRSIEFTLKKNKIRFLIGGGNGTKSVGVALVVDGKQVLFEQANGSILNSEKMLPVTWNISLWRGKSARIVIIDGSAADWGHINVDDFYYA